MTMHPIMEEALRPFTDQLAATGPRVLFQSHDDGHEEDPALAVALTVTVHPQVGPVFTFNGPDGEVELIGAQAALDVAHAILRAVSAQDREADKPAAAAEIMAVAG